MLAHIYFDVCIASISLTVNRCSKSWEHISQNFTSSIAGPLALWWRSNGHGGVSNHQPHHCLLHRLFGCRSKKTSKLRVTGLCAGNHRGPVNSPQMASNAKNVSIWWRHHGTVPVSQVLNSYSWFLWIYAMFRKMSLITGLIKWIYFDSMLEKVSLRPSAHLNRIFDVLDSCCVWITW